MIELITLEGKTIHLKEGRNFRDSLITIIVCILYINIT